MDYAIPFLSALNPLANGVAVADWIWIATSPGYFFNGLTRDDVGGLRYLLSTNNVNLESLLPDVYGAGTNADNPT